MKLLSENRTYDVVILLEFLINTPEEIIYASEQFIITQKRLEGHKLTNATGGGDGAGINQSEETLEKHRLRAKERWAREEYRQKCKDRWSDQNFLQKEAIRLLDPNTVISHCRAYYANRIEPSIEQIKKIDKRIVEHIRVAEKDPIRAQRSLKMIEFLQQRRQELQTQVSV